MIFVPDLVAARSRKEMLWFIVCVCLLVGHVITQIIVCYQSRIVC